MPNYTFSMYRDALDGVGPKLKEIILERAAHDVKISLVALAARAYPDEV